MHRYRRHRSLTRPSPRAALPCLLLLGGCNGISGSFTPASEAASNVSQLFWIMTFGGGLIWLAVIGLALYASHLRPRQHELGMVRLFLLGGGVTLPVIVLGALLAFGLSLLAKPPPAAAGVRLEVICERWWWRVVYHRNGEAPVAVANEIRLPVGEPAELSLRTRDVIHSFWVPALAGKLDLIPGRINRMVVQPTRTGLFRGQCAEYCGTGHANMALYVEVMERGAFDGWLERQALPARTPEDARRQHGKSVFFAQGCDLCHAIRGTAARGAAGPDLTHVGSRHSLAAGLLPPGEASLRRWIRRADALKPRALMPSYPLADDELDALAAYLDHLR